MTLDDAAERKIAELAKKCCDMTWSEEDVRDVIAETWRAATGAAALKCEAEQIQRRDMGEEADHAYNNACRDCAAAIRGKGG